MKSLNIIFLLANYSAVVGWILLIGFPRASFTDFTVQSVIAVLLAVIYGYLLLVQKDPAGEKFVKGSFTTLKGVIRLFKNSRVVLVGWVHFLAFDLLTGLYIKNDALLHGVDHWMVIPCLLLTLMFGPLGFLAYFLLKLVMV
ncbi:MAG: ABA4-like family protein [Saprospiraceae bacterium]